MVILSFCSNCLNLKMKISLPENAKYTSKTIQNEILSVVSSDFKNDGKRNSTWNIYSIVVNEAKDKSNVEQINIYVQYISDNYINQQFLGYLELKKLHAKALANNIYLILSFINLDIQNCIGQSYDGASVMPGTINNV